MYAGIYVYINTYVLNAFTSIYLYTYLCPYIILCKLYNQIEYLFLKWYVYTDTQNYPPYIYNLWTLSCPVFNVRWGNLPAQTFNWEDVGFWHITNFPSSIPTESKSPSDHKCTHTHTRTHTHTHIHTHIHINPSNQAEKKSNQLQKEKRNQNECFWNRGERAGFSSLSVLKCQKLPWTSGGKNLRISAIPLKLNQCKTYRES